MTDTPAPGATASRRTARSTVANGTDIDSANAKLHDAFDAVAGEVETIVKDKLGQVRQAASVRYHDASVRADHTREQLDDFVRTRPWEAVAFAALAGVAFGLFLKR